MLKTPAGSAHPGQIIHEYPTRRLALPVVTQQDCSEDAARLEGTVLQPLPWSMKVAADLFFCARSRYTFHPFARPSPFPHPPESSPCRASSASST
jgi:hypothetical protein